MSDGGDILLDILRRWVNTMIEVQLKTLSSAETSETQLRFAQGKLSAYRDLEQILANPADKLKRLLTEKERDEIGNE